MGSEKYSRERGEDGNRENCKKVGKNGEEERKKAEKRKEHQNTQAKSREMFQKKASDFPLSSHKYCDKGFGIYQKGKKEKQKLSSRGPNTLGIQ